MTGSNVDMVSNPGVVLEVSCRGRGGRDAERAKNLGVLSAISRLVHSGVSVHEHE